MAGYRETFGANVDYAYSQAQRGKSDIANNLNQLVSAGKGATAMVGQYAAAKRSVKDLGNTMSDLRRQIESATDPRVIKKLTTEFEAARKSADNFRKSMSAMPFNAMEKGLGSITKGLISFNANILKMGFDFLINSIKRVYELQERWTKAIGGFNMKLGGMTKGMAGATKAAVQWSSTIRGLTGGSIEEGIQMFGEFTMAIGRTVKAGDGFSKLGMQMARGFGIGGQGAGQILKVFENIGMSADDSAEAMKVSIKAANQAGIPVNMLAEDLSKSVTYMARFGKEGQKTLIQGAAWARKYDIALDQLRQSVEGFDMFDEAAKSASKLNTAFGTMINSMDLMMEDDPAKRLDMIRQQMLAQGLTYDKLSPKQRRYFSETLKLSDEQTAALLDATNAGESYSDFQAKAEKKQKQELAAKAMMQKMLVKTAQTMYNFGGAFDRVTQAIAKAIRPLLEVLGLAKKGDKDFGSFGGVMENITKTVIKFFESLAKNDRWMGFMKELGKDLQRAGSALKEFVMSGRAADLVGDIAKGMKSFYITVRDLAIKAVPLLRPFLDAILFLSQHIKELAVAWAGLKVFNMAGGTGTISKIADMVGGGGGGGGKGRFGRIAGALGKSGIAGAIGGAAGGLIGGKGAGIGSAVGGIAGSFLGPLGMVLGPIVGGFIGKGIEKLFTTTGKDALAEAQDRLAKTMKSEMQTREAHEKMEQAFTARRKADDIVRRAGNDLLVKMEKSARSSKEKDIVLSKQEAAQIAARANELALFVDKTKISKDMLSQLGEGSRLTVEQLKALNEGSTKYGTALSDLRDVADRLLQQQLAQLEVSELGVKKESMKAAIAQAEADVTSGRALQKAGVKQFDVGASSELADYAKYATAGIDERGGGIQFANKIDAMIDMQSKQSKQFEAARSKLSKKEQESLDLSMKIRKAELFQVNSKDALLRLETDYLKEERVLKMRALEMGSGRFLEFQKTSGIEDTSKAFDAYLEAKRSELSGLYGDRGFELLSTKPQMLASGGVVTRPTKAIIGEAGPEAVIPLSRMRENLAVGSGGTTQVVTQIAEVTLDGQKVGRALVKSTIRGRN